MSAEPEWSASFRKVAEIAIATSRARWFAVEAKATQRPATLAELTVHDQAAGKRLIARLETWVDPAAVPIVAGGVDGNRVWLVYADPMSAAHDLVDPMGAQDVVTLGLELTAVIQRARAVGLGAPPLDPRLIVHDFLSDGTFRPRLLGVGTPGPADDERQLAAGIGAALYGALLGSAARTLGWVPGQPPPVSFREARGGRVPGELEQTIARAMALGYDTLDELRADLSSTSLTRSRTSARVGVITDRYSTRGGRVTEGSVVGPLPAAPSAPADAGPNERKRALWSWFALAIGGVAIALWLTSTGDAPPATVPASAAPMLAATAPRERVVEIAAGAVGDTTVAVDTTPIASAAAETATGETATGETATAGTATAGTATTETAAPDRDELAGEDANSRDAGGGARTPDASTIATAPHDAFAADTVLTAGSSSDAVVPHKPRTAPRPRPPAPAKAPPSNGPSDIILDR